MDNRSDEPGQQPPGERLPGQQADGQQGGGGPAGGEQPSGQQADGQQAGGQQADATTQRPVTGEPRVDAALARLDELADLPVTEHRAVFDHVHRRLSEVLGELDTGVPLDAGGGGQSPAAGRAGAESRPG